MRARFAFLPILIALSACTGPSLTQFGSLRDSDRAQAPAVSNQAYDRTDDEPTGPARDVVSEDGADQPYDRPMRLKSVVRDDPRLFSKAEDHKPWPKEGSPEWEAEKARDARREKEVEQSLHICQNC